MLQNLPLFVSAARPESTYGTTQSTALAAAPTPLIFAEKRLGARAALASACVSAWKLAAKSSRGSCGLQLCDQISTDNSVLLSSFFPCDCSENFTSAKLCFKTVTIQDFEES